MCVTAKKVSLETIVRERLAIVSHCRANTGAPVWRSSTLLVTPVHAPASIQGTIVRTKSVVVWLILARIMEAVSTQNQVIHDLECPGHSKNDTGGI